MTGEERNRVRERGWGGRERKRQRGSEVERREGGRERKRGE